MNDVDYARHVRGLSDEPTLEEISKQQRSEAVAMLSLDRTSLPTWFSGQLRFLLGPIPPLDITVVAARPGCGKTTFLLSQARHMVAAGQRVLFVGTESPGWNLRVQLAAQECKLPVDYVVQNRWDELPAGAKERVIERLDAFDRETAGRWFFAPEDTIDHVRLLEYVVQAGESGASVFVDHLHEIDWGGGTGEMTGAMSDGVRRLKEVAKSHRVRLFLAAQLRRTGVSDVLADYMRPDQGAIKQSGTIEEVAHTVILMHRALKPDATEGDLALVRRGQKQMEDIVEYGTSIASIGKCRRVGSARDKEARLYVGNGELYDSHEARKVSEPVEWFHR
jgi:replicative DNA helicase